MAGVSPGGGWLVGARPYALLLGLCLLLYLPGQAAIPVLDRDEARFAQATRQMLETGDFLHIRFQNSERNAKPPGIYWLQAAAVAAFSTPASDAIWPYRLPSLVGATGAVLLLFTLGSVLCDGSDPAEPPEARRRAALIAAMLLAAALGVVAEAHIAKTDAMLLAAVTAGQGALGLAYVRARAAQPSAPWIAATFWAAEIAAIFLKGPIGPGLAALTIASLTIADRDASWLRGLRLARGLAAVAVAVAPWLFAIENATAGRFLADSMGRDFIGKLISAQEAHGAPPLSYLLLAFGTFWPGSLLLVPAVIRGWQRRRLPLERFLMAWLVPGWVCLELVPTKLPHYILPLYPALALLAAGVFDDGARVAAAGRSWVRWAERAGLALWVVAGLALAGALIGLPLRFGQGPTPLDAIGAAALLIGVATVPGRLLFRHDRRAAPMSTGLVAALSLAFAMPAAIGVLPRLDRLWLSRAAEGLVARPQRPPLAGSAAALVVVGYSEPSLVFLLGGKPRLLLPSAAAAALDAGGGEALVSDRDAAAFRHALAARGLAERPLGSVSGLDYSNGKHLVLMLYAVGKG